MSAKAPVNITITNGKNADQIVEALKYAYDKRLGKAIRPWFEIRRTPESIRPYRTARPETTRVLASIIGLRYESGTPGRFMLTMSVLDGIYLAYYNADTRQGNLIEKL